MDFFTYLCYSFLSMTDTNNVPVAPRHGYDYENLDPQNLGSGDPFDYAKGGITAQRLPLDNYVKGKKQDPLQIDTAFGRRAWIPALASEVHDVVNATKPTTALEQTTQTINALRYVERTWYDRSARLIQAIEYGDDERAERLARELNSSLQEIYPLPDKNKVLTLISADSSRNEMVADAYSQELEKGSAPTEEAVNLEKKYEAELSEIAGVIKEMYGEIIDESVPEDSVEVYTPHEVEEILNQLILKLKEEDPTVAWGRVGVFLEDGGVVFSTKSSDGKVTVNVPSDSNELNATELRGIISHELLWHAARAANGWEAGKNDKQLADILGVGAPFYLRFEEAMAIICELAFTGKIEQIFIDRYIDIAIAAGVLDDKIRTRHELQEFVFKRELTRKGYSSDEQLTVAEQKELRIHVDRIYRGGDGGDENKFVVIFPKDGEYFGGAEPSLQWWQSQRAEGKSASEIFIAARRGKINPMIPGQSELVPLDKAS